MRKHNEGYTLVLVMVVLTVLSLLATVILTASQRNLDAHKNGIAYMQNKYLAQGEIEKILGELEKMAITDDPENVINASEEYPIVSITKVDEDVQVGITSKSGTVVIDCTLLLVDGVIGQSGELINLDGYSYLSYKISTDGGAGE